MTQPDGTDFYSGKIQYAVGLVLECTDFDGSKEACGKGLHLGKEKHSPLQYNAKYPWKLFECSYDPMDVLGEDDKKVRVRKLTVEKALDPHDIGIPNADRFFSIVNRVVKIKLRHNPKALKKIESYIKKQNEILEKRTGKKIPYHEVKAYTLHEWDSVRDSVRDSVWASVRDSVWASVRDSVRDSVRASVRDSVRDSVWASVRDSVIEENSKNPFLPEFEILELGAVFYGIDKDGIAHVIMPGKDEVA